MVTSKKHDLAKCEYKFEQSKCNFPVWINEDKFCIFHSHLLDEKREEFRIEFEKYLSKIEEEPNELNVIHGFIFPETLTLHSKEFSSTIWFWNCKFSENLEIDRCRFDADFRMNSCKINGSSKIKWSHFNKVFTFNESYVKGDFEFHLNKVISDTIVIGSQIDDYFALKYSSFSGEISILDTVVKNSWYIYAIDFSKASRTRFRNLDFTNVHFFDSKLIDIDFVGITWRTHKNRIIIGDEMVFRNQKNPIIEPQKDFKNLSEWESFIEALYLQLCTNFDNNRFFNIAGKFYISAMEMRRCSNSNWLKQNIFSWEAWYKYISSYGQSAKRAFWIMIFVLLFCSFIISFDPNIHQLDTLSTSDSFFQNISLSTRIFLKALKYNLYSLIHPAGWSFKDQISLTAFVTAWERILILILGTFFLLSLKRRFRRN